MSYKKLSTKYIYEEKSFTSDNKPKILLCIFGEFLNQVVTVFSYANFFCFLIAMNDLVQGLGAMNGLCKLLTVSGNVFF